MKEIIFHTADMTNMEQIHTELARLLDFPGHYGRNLDALYDCLSGETALPLKMVWTDYRRTRAKLGADVARFLAVLKDFAREEPDFRIEIS